MSIDPSPPVRRGSRPGHDDVALARELALADWASRRSFRGDDYRLERLLALKRETVSVILPTRNVGGTLGDVLATVAPLRAAGLLDEVMVVDAASTDGTLEAATAYGVTVYQESEILPAHGPARGKGDAMWRGLSVTTGQTVAFLDTDTENFSERFVLGLLGPLIEHPEIELVKGAFSRPFKVGGLVEAEGGGRVTELVARPFLNLHVPELAGFVQPLAGEIAARRGLLEAIPFPVGYGIEIAMMIDAVRLVGVDALAQSDLGVRQNRHQSLRELSAMAYAVLVAAERRVHPEAKTDPGPLALPLAGGYEMRQMGLEERPPLAALRVRNGG